MADSKLTQGEYNALLKIWPRSPTGQPKGVQWRTVENLIYKEMLEYEKSAYGYFTFWLSDAGKKAMDEYPHLKRMKKGSENGTHTFSKS